MYDAILVTIFCLLKIYAETTSHHGDSVQKRVGFERRISTGDENDFKLGIYSRDMLFFWSRILLPDRPDGRTSGTWQVRQIEVLWPQAEGPWLAVCGIPLFRRPSTGSEKLTCRPDSTKFCSWETQQALRARHRGALSPYRLAPRSIYTHCTITSSSNFCISPHSQARAAVRAASALLFVDGSRPALAGSTWC